MANQVLPFVFLKQFLETGTPIKPKRTPIKPWPLKLIIKFELQGRSLLHLAWSNWWDSQHTNSCLQNLSWQSLSSFSIFLTCFINSNMGKGSKSFIISLWAKSLKGVPASCTSFWICGCSILALISSFYCEVWPLQLSLKAEIRNHALSQFSVGLFHPVTSFVKSNSA